ncbi:hypothetical protein DAI43_15855 [Achromobacter xylosoxidans]|uniref:hypothetical protein n=1 Tax=Achromobacter TaxID=222 RepID=UPI000D44F95F|nr:MULTISPECIES: hypothetical protein [Achromobacter]MCP2518469.1 hypothetical protein [Achromobacter mucicolens]MDQ1758143.1 hypothetical protein [Achromobacter aegrifaciens]PTN50583.1 hypothetical protein DAI43_15855 [Achromobacter xylosoxidans]CAB3910071.1 hypothetical protein LMG26684_05061 [Achromobacter mucicolens]
MQSIQTPFFTLTVKGSFVHIKSTGLAGAQGVIHLVERDALETFDQLLHVRESSYTNWAEDPYPVECGAVLLRVDDITHAEYGRLQVELERHPSSGSLALGEPEQEQIQLQALLQLRHQVMHLFEITRPDEAARACTAERAQILLRQAKGLTFLPPEGYCYRCEEDVTLEITDATGMTGCPKCHVSWCD